jgi:hypothetical protein
MFTRRYGPTTPIWLRPATTSGIRRRRPILRLLAVATIVTVLLAVLAFAAGRASSAPAPPTPTTTAGAAYTPAPAGPPITDPNGQWIPQPDPSSNAGGSR